MGEPILLIDPADLLRSAMAHVLSRQGFDVTDARDASEVKEPLTGRRFRAAVVNATLPDSDGLTALAALRQIDRDLPVLIVTSEEGDSTEELVRVADAAARHGASLMANPSLAGLVGRLTQLAATQSAGLEPLAG